MPQIGTWLLANIFTALLPPLGQEDDRDFYEILGVSRDATAEDIRKAYKVQSLKLHPDKIAQRRQFQSAEQARQQYEHVQEAYGVLMNDTKRQRYHALQCSPKRYRFVSQGAVASPGALYENLTNATTMDKTRLVVLCTLIVLTVLAQPILIASKVNHIVAPEGDGGLESAKWIVLLIPTWIMGATWVLFHVLLMALAPMPAKLSVFGSFLEYLLWLIGGILLALKWDNSISSKYAQVLIPLYLAMVLKWILRGLLLAQIRHDVGRMVTVEHLEKDILEGKSLEELTEEERANLQKTYLVVTVPEGFEPMEIEAPPEGQEPDMTPEEYIELQKVEASPEYEAAMDIYFSTLGTLVGSMLFGIVFMIVLTLKLDRQLDASYWVIFIPIWIHLGSRWVYFCFTCACSTVSGEEILLQMQQSKSEDDNKGEKTTDGEDNEQQQEGEETKETGDEELGLGGSKEKKGAEKSLSGGKSPKDRPRENDFVDADASVSRFNASSKSSSFGDDGSSKASASSKSKSKKEKKAKSEESMPTADDTTETTKTTSKTETKVDDEKKEDDTKTAVGDDKDDDHIHIDEETFHAWQNAYEEAERGAMEQQAKAFVECLNLTVQLMVIIMVVAKIDKSYWGSDDPADPGYNTFWILFPFFLFFGLILCCCACLIYGAEPGKASDLEQHESDGGETEKTSENPVILTPPPPESTTSNAIAGKPVPVEASFSEENLDIEEGETKKEQEETAPDMDDLD